MAFLIHNRDIYSAQATDIRGCAATAGETRFLRRSRASFPLSPIFLRQPAAAAVLARAELKSTVCLTKGDKAFISQHIATWRTWPPTSFFQKTIDHMQRILAMRPEIIACDLHPDYLSTRWADEQSTPKVRVQHHHAHIVS